MDRVHHGVRPVGARIYEAISLELVRARRTKGRVGVTETGRLSESFGCLVPREGDALRIGRRCQCELSGDVILGQGHAALRGEAIFGLAEDTRPTLAKGGCRHAREAILAGACPPRGGETHGRDEPGPGCHRVRECSAARRDRASDPGARGFARIPGRETVDLRTRAHCAILEFSRSLALRNGSYTSPVFSSRNSNTASLRATATAARLMPRFLSGSALASFRPNR